MWSVSPLRATLAALAVCFLGSCAAVDLTPQRCEVRSLAPVFDNPTEYFGTHFCGEVRAILRENARVVLLFPVDRSLPDDIHDLAIALEGRAFLDFLDSLPSDALSADRVVYVEGRIDGMRECFVSAEPSAPNVVECVPFRRPLWVRGRLRSNPAPPS